MMALAGVVAARTLGPSGRGIVTAVIAWPLMLSYLSLFGIQSSSTVRIANPGRSDLTATLGGAVAFSLVAGGLVSLAAIAVLPSALSHLGPDAAVLTAWSLATIPLIMLTDILLAVNVALGRVTVSNWCRVINAAVLLFGTLPLAVVHAVTPTRVVLLSIVANLPTFIYGAIGLPWRRMAISLPMLFEDLRFGIKAHCASVLGIANFRLDVLLISAFMPASQLGYYGVANNMMMPVMFGPAAAASLLTPRVASMDADGRGGIDRAQFASIWTDVRRFGLVGIAGAGIVAACAPFLVPIVFGSGFEPVVVLVWVLLPGYVARNYAVMLTAGALGGRRPWVGNAVEGAGVLVTVTMLPLLLPRYEALGAAITSTAAYSVSALIAVLAIRRIQGRPRDFPAHSIKESERAAQPPTARTVNAGNPAT